jgi:hypothetical protein
MDLVSPLSRREDGTRLRLRPGCPMSISEGAGIRVNIRQRKERTIRPGADFVPFHVATHQFAHALDRPRRGRRAVARRSRCWNLSSSSAQRIKEICGLGRLYQRRWVLADRIGAVTPTLTATPGTAAARFVNLNRCLSNRPGVCACDGRCGTHGCFGSWLFHPERDTVAPVGKTVVSYWAQVSWSRPGAGPKVSRGSPTTFLTRAKEVQI